MVATTKTFTARVDARKTGRSWEYAAGLIVSMSDYGFPVTMAFDSASDEFIFTVVFDSSKYGEDEIEAGVDELKSFRYGIFNDAGGIDSFFNLNWL